MNHDAEESRDARAGADDDLEIKSRGGYSSLALAAMQGKNETCLVLIECDADLHTKHNDGTALSRALRVTRVLIDNVVVIDVLANVTVVPLLAVFNAFAFRPQQIGMCA